MVCRCLRPGPVVTRCFVQNKKPHNHGPFSSGRSSLISIRHPVLTFLVQDERGTLGLWGLSAGWSPERTAYRRLFVRRTMPKNRCGSFSLRTETVIRSSGCLLEGHRAKWGDFYELKMLDNFFNESKACLRSSSHFCKRPSSL